MLQKRIVIIFVTMTVAACNPSYELPDDGVIDPNSSTPYSSSSTSFQTSSSSQSNGFPTSDQHVEAGCKVGGCSSHVCVNAEDEDVITTCEWRESYACYATARCEKQSSGKCGWTKTTELTTCLERAG